MHLSEHNIRKEIEMRRSLQTVVEGMLDRLYQFDPCTKDRVGRATVHTAISERLGLMHNNTLSAIIKAALAAKGAVPQCSRGLQYYKGMRERRHG